MMWQVARLERISLNFWLWRGHILPKGGLALSEKKKRKCSREWKILISLQEDEIVKNIFALI